MPGGTDVCGAPNMYEPSFCVASVENGTFWVLSSHFLSSLYSNLEHPGVSVHKRWHAAAEITSYSLDKVSTPALPLYFVPSNTLEV